MKLLLTSAGFTNTSIVNALKNLVEKPLNELRIAHIPTAANIETGDKSWLIRDLERSNNLGWKEFDIVDFSAILKELWLPRLEKADVLFFEGGNVSHLLYCMRKFGLDKILPKMLTNKVYVGSSAGSMAATKNLALSNEKKKELAKQIGEYFGEDGLGYVDFHIRPHFNSPYFPHAHAEKVSKIADEMKETIYAIDDNTAIKVVDGNVEVISEGEWKKFN